MDAELTDDELDALFDFSDEEDEKKGLSSIS